MNNLAIDDVKEILSKIKFAPYSCLDMKYDFEAKSEGGLYLIRSSFMRKDIISGEFGKGWGRWHTTPISGATETSIVMTAWVCIKMIIEHEAFEGFEYIGKKVFHPHKTLDQLIYPETFSNE